jgi:hypothetical protein
MTSCPEGPVCDNFTLPEVRKITLADGITFEEHSLVWRIGALVGGRHNCCEVLGWDSFEQYEPAKHFSSQVDTVAIVASREAGWLPSRSGITFFHSFHHLLACLGTNGAVTAQVRRQMTLAVCRDIVVEPTKLKWRWRLATIWIRSSASDSKESYYDEHYLDNGTLVAWKRFFFCISWSATLGRLRTIMIVSQKGRNECSRVGLRRQLQPQRAQK